MPRPLLWILKFSILFTLFIGFGFNSYAQTKIHEVTFESAGGYTSSLTECTDNSGDYFLRTDGSDINGSFTNVQGSYFFAAQDIDAVGCPAASGSETLTITGINISGYTSLEVRIHIAEDDDGSNQDWDASDYFHLDGAIDAGTNQNLIWVASTGGTNNEPLIDTDYDGTGDGTAITDAFAQFTNSITGTGSTLELTLEFDLDSGDEDIAVDNIEIWGTAAGGNTVTFYTNGGDGGSTPAQTETSSTALTSNGFTRTGYTFDHWDTQADDLGTDYADGATYGFGADMDLYAQWTINNYTVTFDGNGEDSGAPSAASVSGDYNTNVTLATQNTLVKADHTFIGWNTLADSTGTDYAAGASYTVLDDITLYAKWRPIRHDVTFDKNDAAATGSMSNQTINQGASANLTSNTYSNAGYTFDEWNTASDGSGTSYADGASYTMGTSDVTLYAQWVAVTCFFDVAGGGSLPSGWSGTNNNTTEPIDKSSYYLVEPGSPGDYLITASSDLCVFDSAVFSVDIGSFGSGSHNSLLVEVSLDGGSSYTQSYTTNITTGSAETPISPDIGISPLSDDMVLRFSVNSSSGRGIRMQNIKFCGNGTGSWCSGHTVTFNNNGGSGTMSNQTESSSTALTLNTFTRTGYTFDEWNTAADGSGTAYADGATYSFSADMDLYAQWTINNYTVTFSGNSATSGSPSVPNVSGDYNTSVTLATQSTLLRTGYSFDGWNTETNGSGTDYAAGASYTVIDDTTLYAKWTLITYTVSFDNNTGSGTKPDQIEASGATENLETNFTITKTGHTFTGWNTAADGSGAAYADGGSYTWNADETLYAQWSIRNYTVDFDENGGTGAASVGSISGDYNTTGTLASQGTLARTNFTFEGWNTQSDTLGTDYVPGATYTFSAANGNMTLYAKWKQITHDVTFDKNAAGATGSMADQTIGQGSSANLTTNAYTYTGFTFDGWNTASDGSGTDYADGVSYTMGASDITLYAQWVAPAPCAELFFSEYVEGNSNDKCIEIFNGSGSSINLGTGSYAINLYSNGASSASSTMNLSGTIADGDVYVVCNSSANATFLAAADATDAVANFNGDDAIELVKGGTTIDIFGYIGCDPGSDWSSGSHSTLDQTLVRKSSVTAGITTNPSGTCNSGSFPTLVSEWDYYAASTDTYIGSHTGNCTAVTEINVLGNGVSISDGDTSPDHTDSTDFGQTQVGGTPMTATYTIENVGTDTLFLTGTSPFVSIGGTHAADFTVLTPYPSDTILPGESTTFTIEFDPGALGDRDANVSIANSDDDEDPYNFDITGEGTYDQNSSITLNMTTSSYNGGTPGTKIEYIDYQSTPGVAQTSSGTMRVMRFDLNDVGGDGQATVLTDISFTVEDAGSTDQISQIRHAVLSTFTGSIQAVGSIVGSELVFTGLNPTYFTASEADTTTLNLRVSYNNDASIVDNTKFVFQVSSATASTSGSVFGSADAGGAITDASGDNKNRINVTATALDFGQQPSDATQDLSMIPAVTVQGEDVNGNVDLDWTDDVDITSSGTLTGAPVTVAAVAGVATFSTLQHSATGTGLTLTAGHSTFSDVVSSTFDITTFSYAAGDYRPKVDNTDLSYNGAANWEYYNGTSWINNPDVSCGSPCAPQNATVTPTRVIIHRPGITGGGNTTNSYNDIIILSGGELILNDVDNPPVASEFILAGKTLEIKSGGRVELNGDIDLNATANLIVREGGELELSSAKPIVTGTSHMGNDHPIWDGVENFENGSILRITDWDWSASPINRSLLNVFSQVTGNSNDYKFGEVIFDATPTDDWTIVGGPLQIKVAENNFTVINKSATYYVAGMSNKYDSVYAEYGGNFYVEDGDFTFGSSYTNDNFYQNMRILGDFEMTSDGSLNLHLTGNNTPTAVASRLYVHGDFIVDGPSAFDSDLPSPGTNAMKLILTGSNFDTLLIEPIITHVPIYVAPDDSVLVIDHDLRFEDDTEIEVESGAYFNFGFDAIGTALNVVAQPTATGNLFQFKAGASLVITNPDGIWELTGTSLGNVKGMTASEKSFGQSGSTFYYVGKTNQQTGDAFTTGQTTKDIYVILENDLDTLTVTSTTGIANSNKLEIQSGVVDNTTSAYIYGNGDLIMTGGGLRTNIDTTEANTQSSSSGYVPLLSGAYTIDSGFVEIYSSGEQILRGTRDYYRLIVAGNNSLGTKKSISSPITIEYNLYITDNSTFDIDNTSMTGNANLTMDNGLFRMSRLNDPLPQLSATYDDRPYDLTGGVIELYGTDATQSQILRGKDDYNVMTNSQRTIEYWNLEINSDAANTDDYNVNVDANIEVGNVMNINSPAVFQLDNDDHIDDVQFPFNAGEFYLKPGATLKYGDDYGITTTGSGVTSGAVRVTGNGTRDASVFPTTASYGFVSPNDQVSGNALPSTVENLYVDKTNRSGAGLVPEDAAVTLTNSVTINSTLKMDQGHIITDGNTIELGTNASNRGTLAYGQDSPQIPGFVIGEMKRWFDGTNSGNASGLFPMGDTVYTNDTTHFRNRHAIIEYTGAPGTGGSLTNSYDGETQMALNGIPFASQVAADNGCLAFDVTTTEDEGFWNIDAGDGLSGGTYTATLTGEDYFEVTNLCQLTLLKRATAGSPWTGPGVGTHVASTAIAGSSLSFPKVRRTGLSGFSDFGFGGGEDNLLPVELLSFIAYKKVRTSQLEWVTASEVNNDKFIILHSINGVNFYPIGEVAGAGTSFTQNEYEFTHEQPVNGKNYYRIKQVDFDGTSALSVIRMVEHEDAFPYSVQVMGNPVTNGELEVSITAAKKMATSLALFAADGRLIDLEVIEILKGTSTYRMNMDDFAEGVYFLSVSNDEMNQGFKVMKSR